MALHHHFRPAVLTLAAATAMHAGALAQTTVTVTGRIEPALGVGGFGEAPSRSPLQAVVLGSASLREAGVGALSGLGTLDAGVADAYNAPGYWSGISTRGFVVDARNNYRRDGLPINAETSLSLVNKDRVEVLKGASGILAGTSAPGGLVNLVVKRPTATLREAAIDWTDRATVAATVDLSERFGSRQEFGARINGELARLRPSFRNQDGRRSLFALAVDWLPQPEARLEVEFESSRQSQPSVPGFSLTGDRLPDARSIDPRTNLNNQPWSLPVVLDGDTASLRWQQRLGADLQAQAHVASQRLRSDDRIAFPFGCSNLAEVYYADRYCPDGSFDLYDFRSEGERRRTDAADLQLQWRHRSGAVEHRLVAGVMATRARDRFGRQAFNYVGAGTIAGDLATPPDPTLTDENTNRDERSRELYLRDAMRIGAAWQLWGGLRHTQLHRRSVRTDGSRPIDVNQTFTVPWVALAWTPSSTTMAYASWGGGVESEVAPNRSRYLNAGQALPALESRQLEAGVKIAADSLEASAALFDITRPVAGDLCLAEDRCERRIDGEARHRGLELSGQFRQGPWSVRATAMALHARRQGSSDPLVNGRRPPNVPDRSLTMQLTRLIGPSLALSGALVHEGRRAVLPDNSVMLGSWTRVDAWLSWRLPTAGVDTRLRLGVDNLADRRGWRESPYQFAHAYLMPLQRRSGRATLQVAF